MLIATVILFLVGILSLALLVTLISHLWVRAPFVPTPKRVVTTMVELANLKPGEHVYDLGAGDGRLLITSKRSVPDIVAAGWEFAPTVWLLGKLRILCSRQNVTLHLGDALHADLRDADCIFLYLMPGLMAALQKKFDAELKPGTRVLSYVFRFPEKTPEREVPVPWLLETKMLSIYRW